MISGEADVIIFTRFKERDKWTFHGLAKPIDVRDEVPFVVSWSFDDVLEPIDTKKFIADETSPEVNEAYRFLYVARAVDLATLKELGSSKVGIAKNHLDKRIGSLNSTKMPIAVQIRIGFEFYHGAHAAEWEKKLHEHLKTKCVNGEWFNDPDGNLIHVVEQFLVRNVPIEVNYRKIEDSRWKN